MSDINITKFLLDLEGGNLIPDENTCTNYVTLPSGITTWLFLLESFRTWHVFRNNNVEIT